MLNNEVFFTSLFDVQNSLFDIIFSRHARAIVGVVSNNEYKDVYLYNM